VAPRTPARRRDPHAGGAPAGWPSRLSARQLGPAAQQHREQSNLTPGV